MHENKEEKPTLEEALASTAKVIDDSHKLPEKFQELIRQIKIALKKDQQSGPLVPLHTIQLQPKTKMNGPKKTPHTATHKGKRVRVVLMDGTSFIDRS